MAVETKPRSIKPGIRGRTRPAGGIAALGIAASLLLTGCGDMTPDDVRDLIDKAQEVAEGLSDEGDPATEPDAPGDPEFEESMREAREDWGTRPPSPDVPPLGQGIEETAVDSAGQQSAREETFYPQESADAIEDHYTEQYGQEPTRTDDRTLTWSDGDSETSMTTNFDDTVTVDSSWNKP